MGSHAMTNVSFPAFSKDSAKKKRANRLARLKRNKLEVRREQLLSQVKYKSNKVDSNEKGGSPPPPPPPPHCTGKTIKGLEFGEDLHKGIRERVHATARVHHHDRESETLTSSYLIRGNIWHYGSGRDSSISSSSCCSGIVSEEEADDGCLDNWEDIADLLTRTSSGSQHAPKKSPVIATKPEPNAISDSSKVVANKDTAESSPFNNTREAPPQSRGSCRAWSLDDACRPQNLPNVSKQAQIVHGAKVWPWQSLMMSQPSSCPVCCEDFDVTDSRFLPCPCGFRLCLFCHKRIVESDGRCPGCRKQYDSGYYSSGFCVGPTQFQTAPSCSTNVGIKGA